MLWPPELFIKFGDKYAFLGQDPPKFRLKIRRTIDQNRSTGTAKMTLDVDLHVARLDLPVPT